MLTNTKILAAQEKKLYKAKKEQTFLHKQGVKEIILLMLMAFDAVCMLQAIDLYFTQKRWMSWIVTIAMAFVLDVPPMLLGVAVQDRKLSPGAKRLQIIGLLSAFLLTYLGTFALRFASMDQMFPVSTLQIGGVTMQQTQEGHTAGQYIMSLILAVLPLGTSICSFVLGMQNSVEEKVRHQLRLNSIELQQQVDWMKVAHYELSEDMKFDLEKYDEERYQIRIQTIHDQADILESDSKKALSEKVGTAEAVSELMEKTIQIQQGTADNPSIRLNKSA